jgi:hypothetical protein
MLVENFRKNFTLNILLANLSFTQSFTAIPLYANLFALLTGFDDKQITLWVEGGMDASFWSE